MNLTVNNKTLFSYAIMALPLAMAGIPLYIHAPDLYAKEYGISLSVIGFTLLILRIIDAITDPLIGILSDAFSKFKKQIFIFGLFLLGVGFYLLFNPVNFKYIYWFALSVFISSLGFSITSINLMAFGSKWSDDYNIKAKISAFREGFGLIGIIIAVCLPAIILGDSTKVIFQNYSIIMVLILLVCGAIFILKWLTKLDYKQPNSSTFSLKNCWNSIKNKKQFYIVYFFSILASSIPAVLVLIFIRDKLGLEQHAGLFLLSYFLSAALSMPLWNFLSKKYNKSQTWLIAMIFAILTFVWAFFLGKNDFYPYFLVCVLSGIAFAGELAVPPSIMADLVDNETQTTDYSITVFLSKLSLALATGFALPLLEYSGFKTGSENSDDTLNTLSVLYALVPCILKLISASVLYKYFITGGRYEKNFNSNYGGCNA